MAAKSVEKTYDPSQMRDLTKIDGVVAAMLEDGEALLDRSRLLDRLRQFGLAANQFRGLARYQDWYNVTKVGCVQNPTELVDYLLLVARHRPLDYLEIGVFTGGTAVFSCAFLQALDPAIRYTCVDIADHVLLLPQTRARLNIEFMFGKTSDDLAGRAYDVVFIDGDHSYAWAQRDYLNVGRHARKLVAFHDINGKEYLPKGGGIYNYWRTLRASVALEAGVTEFCHAGLGVGHEKDGSWMGIGVIDRTGITGAATAGAGLERVKGIEPSS